MSKNNWGSQKKKKKTLSHHPVEILWEEGYKSVLFLRQQLRVKLLQQLLSEQKEMWPQRLIMKWKTEAVHIGYYKYVSADLTTEKKDIIQKLIQMFTV